MHKNYMGFLEIEVSDCIINDLENNGYITLNDIYQDCKITSIDLLYANSFILFKSLSGYQTVGRYRANNKPITLLQNTHTKITPKNLEQAMAFELLLDPTIKLVTLTGIAGTGKTLLSIAAAKYQTPKKYYDIIITRPIVPMGNDLGYLPGNINEKLNPWVQPFKDNMNVVDGNRNRSLNTINAYWDKFVHIEALTYIRGRTLDKSFIILDEAQNLNLSMLKTIITRVGSGTKIVIVGDTTQIDQKINSGLNELVERFKTFSLSGHVTLIKSERSDLAALASRIL